MCLCKSNPYKTPLYRYFSLKRGAEFLESHSFYMSDPTKCNDPFECMYNAKGSFPHELSPYELYWLNTKHVFPRLQQFGIQCFSTLNDSILMWAYYAESHKGICIEFAPQADLTSFAGLYNMHYNNRFGKIKRDRDFYDVLDVLTTKSKVWSHEKEVRLIKDGMADALLSINPNAIKSIILGASVGHFRTSKDSNRIVHIHSLIKALQKPEYQHVKIQQVQVDLNKYKLHIEEVPFIVWEEGLSTKIVSTKDQSIIIERANEHTHSWEVYHEGYMRKYEKLSFILTDGIYYIRDTQQNQGISLMVKNT